MPRIRRLRETLLGGAIMSPAQAEALFSSPASRILTARQFQQRGIPLLDHTARLLGDPRWDSTPTGYITTTTLELTWGDTTVTEELRWEAFVNTPGTRIQEIVLPKGPLVDIWPGSVMGEMHECSCWLARRYPWSEPDALWYLLTGESPSIYPVRLRIDSRAQSDLYDCRITVAVMPWVSADTVLRAYRAAQDLVLAGRDNRSLQARSLALARFIANWHTQHGGKRGAWCRVMAAWNRHAPHWAYERTTQFARDVDRAEKALRCPSYHHPWTPKRGTGIAWQSSLEAWGPLQEQS